MKTWTCLHIVVVGRVPRRRQQPEEHSHSYQQVALDDAAPCKFVTSLSLQPHPPDKPESLVFEERNFFKKWELRQNERYYL